MEYLFEKLAEYGQSDMYPFHMPGHKRKALTEEKTYSIDITEIDGFDNLHHADGILQELQDIATAMYQTEESCLLVNGSTCGLLAAISACCSYGGKILTARNCHKSVYHGILLLGLQAVYLYPEIEPEYGLNGSISPDAVEQALEANKDIQAVLITSPTYDGVTSDINTISQIVHRHGLPLIVDEAHGAHLPFTRGLFPETALRQGADIVIHSLHKTLPAFTQTALLHRNSDRVDKEKIKRYLSVYQSSSPSYILMAGVSSCLKWLAEQGKESFEVYEKRLVYWRKKYQELLAGGNGIKLVDFRKAEGAAASSIYDYDVSKLIFSVKGSEVSGESFYGILRDRYHLQMEMASLDYVLALSSVCDREEGFERLYRALKELKKEITEKKPAKKENRKENAAESNFSFPKAKQIVSLSEAEEKKKRIVRLEESVGFVSASNLYVYPPGIPFLLPGEEITEELIGCVRRLQAAKLKVQGLEEENQIYVLEL